MLVSKIRRHMKFYIWFIVIAFTVSIFFVGAASFLENWGRKDQMARRSPQESPQAQIDPEFDVRSEKPLAMVRMNGKSSVITEGALNRFIITSPLRDRLKEVPEQYRSILTAQLLERMIDEELMVLEGERSNIDVTPKVLSELESLRQKSGSDENFLQQLKMSGWKGVEELKGFMTRNSVVQTMRDNLFKGVEVNDEDIEFYYKINADDFKDKDGKPRPLDEVRETIINQLKEQVSEESLQEYYESHKPRWEKPRKVDLRYLVLDPRSSTIREEVQSQVTEEDVQAYFQENQQDFLTPEQVDIGHILLSKEELKKKVKPEDSQLQKYYSENKDKYLIEEKVKASHILIKTGTETSGTDAEVLDRITNLRKEILEKKTSFEDAAKKNSDDVNSAVQGGDLGLFPRGVMVPEFEEVAFSSEIGKISEPVQTQFGYHIIRVDEKQAARTKEFAEVKEKVLEAVIDQEAKKESEVLITTIENQIKSNTATFEQLAQKYSHASSKDQGGVLKEIFLGEGNDESKISELSTGGVGLDYPILVTLRTLKREEVSDMVETAAGYHFLKLLEKREPVVKEFASVQDEIRELVVANRMADAFELKKASIKSMLTTTNFAEMVSTHSDSEGSSEGNLVEGLVLSNETKIEPFSQDIQLDLGEGEYFHSDVLRTARYLSPAEISRELSLKGKFYFFKVEKEYERELIPYAEVKEEIARAITLKVADEEISQYFEENRSQFSTPAQVVIQQIAYQKEEIAKRQLDQILNGSISFENAGKSMLNMDRSSFLSNQGSVDLPTTSFDDDIRGEISKLNAGEIFPRPAKSPFGYHIVKMAVKSEASQGSLEEARAQIVQTLKQQKRAEIMESYSTELRNKADEIVIF